MLLPLRDVNPTRRVPYVTYVLIALNLAMFAYQFLVMSPLQNHLFIYRHGVVPLFLLSGYGPSLSTLFTSLFMHGSLLHLGFNMLFLHIFGDNVEDAMGHLRYTLFFLFTGSAAALVHALSDPGSQLPMVGASGAISGVLGAYLLMYPRARVLTLVLIFLLEIPAFLFILVWFGGQVSEVLAPASTGTERSMSIALFAHIGGFVAGVLWLLLFGKPQLPPRVYMGPPIKPRFGDRM